jgi:hypothetical protein
MIKNHYLSENLSKIVGIWGSTLESAAAFVLDVDEHASNKCFGICQKILLTRSSNDATSYVSILIVLGPDKLLLSEK